MFISIFFRFRGADDLAPVPLAVGKNHFLRDGAAVYRVTARSAAEDAAGFLLPRLRTPHGHERIKGQPVPTNPLIYLVEPRGVESRTS